MRGLRLIVLFKRAEKGLYFLDKSMIRQDSFESTSEILRATKMDSFVDDSINDSSMIYRPRTPNVCKMMYYWFLFTFEGEISYIYFTLFMTMFPFLLMIYFFIIGDMNVLPVVTYSH